MASGAIRGGGSGGSISFSNPLRRIRRAGKEDRISDGGERDRRPSVRCAACENWCGSNWRAQEATWRRWDVASWPWLNHPPMPRTNTRVQHLHQARRRHIHKCCRPGREGTGKIQPYEMRLQRRRSRLPTSSCPSSSTMEMMTCPLEPCRDATAWDGRQDWCETSKKPWPEE